MDKKQPKPPPIRVIREGEGKISPICKSTMIRSYFFGLIGKAYCDNGECENTK